MNIRLVLLMLLIGHQLSAQEYHPTKTKKDSIYALVEKAQIEKYLNTNPVLVDISEKTRDSLFLVLINNYRYSKGLNKLTYASVLDSACELHTYWMLKEQKVEHDEFSSNRDGKLYPKFTDRILKFDSSWISNHKILFENCGAAKSTIGNDPTIQFKRITKESVYNVFNGWKASPGHNAAMLNEHVIWIGFNLGSKFNAKQNNYLVLGTLLLSN